MPAAGAYGKVPASGDFVRIRLSRSFVAAWDAWLQSWFGAAKAESGAAWPETYLTAPIWRFTLAPGIVGEAPWLGVMAASVDRVGREFPLTLARALPAGADAAAGHFGNDSLFEALERCILAVVQQDVGPERLEAMLDDLPGPSTGRGRDTGPKAWCATDRAALRAHLAAGNVAAGRRSSLWSSDDGETVRLFAAEGLPGAARAQALFRPSHPIWTAGAGAAAQ